MKKLQTFLFFCALILSAACASTVCMERQQATNNIIQEQAIKLVIAFKIDQLHQRNITAQFISGIPSRMQQENSIAPFISGIPFERQIIRVNSSL